MPLGELAGDASENRRSNQIQMATGPATHESIEETIIKPREKGRGEAAAGEKRMGRGFSYETRGLLSAKGRTGQQGRKWGKAIGRLGGKVPGLRTFTVYEDLCAISVRSHQYSLVVYLLVRQAGLAVDDFQ